MHIYMCTWGVDVCCHASTYILLLLVGLDVLILGIEWQQECILMTNSLPDSVIHHVQQHIILFCVLYIQTEEEAARGGGAGYSTGEGGVRQ